MTTIDDLLRNSLAAAPMKTAIRHKEAGAWREISYRDLHAQAEGIASGLAAAGFEAGDRAAIIGHSSPRWVASYFGILRVGGIVVPIDKELKSAEVRHILADSETRILFIDPSFLENLLEKENDLTSLEHIVLFDDPLCKESPLPPEFMLLGEVNDLIKELPDDLSLPPGLRDRLRSVATRISSHLAEKADLPAAGKPENPVSPNRANKKQPPRTVRIVSLSEFSREVELPPPTHAPGDPALILYTSGTTGRSKGAVLSHGNIVSNIRAAATHFQVDETMHTLSFLPINHVFEQVCGLLLPLSVRGTVSFAESLKKLGENLAEARPTFFTAVPAVYRMFHDRILKNIRSKKVSSLLFSLPLARRLVVSGIRANFADGVMFISGGAALDPAIARGLIKMGFDIYQGYGVTETSPVISAECPGRTRLGSVGPVMEGIEVRINRPDQDGIGEILVRGPNVMQGYYRNPQATEEALAGGWYRTGDLGKLDKEGFLFIRGRVKNLIVTPNGKNVYPEEVEAELLKSPLISEAMVYGHKIDAVSEEVHAIVFPCQDALDDLERARNRGPLSQPEVEEIIRREVLAAGKGLADYKRVKKFTLREDEFPKTTTRKIKRYAVEADVSTG